MALGHSPPWVFLIVSLAPGATVTHSQSSLSPQPRALCFAAPRQCSSQVVIPFPSHPTSASVGCSEAKFGSNGHMRNFQVLYDCCPFPVSGYHQAAPSPLLIEITAIKTHFEGKQEERCVARPCQQARRWRQRRPLACAELPSVPALCWSCLAWAMPAGLARL